MTSYFELEIPFGENDQVYSKRLDKLVQLAGIFQITDHADKCIILYSDEEGNIHDSNDLKEL